MSELTSEVCRNLLRSLKVKADGTETPQSSPTSPRTYFPEEEEDFIVNETGGPEDQQSKRIDRAAGAILSKMTFPDNDLNIEKSEPVAQPTLVVERKNLLHIGGNELLNFLREAAVGEALVKEAKELLQYTIVPPDYRSVYGPFFPALTLAVDERPKALKIDKSSLGLILSCAKIEVEAISPDRNSYIDPDRKIIFNLDVRMHKLPRKGTIDDVSAIGFEIMLNP